METGMYSNICVILPKENEAMTKWWLKATAMCFMLSFLPIEQFQPFFDFIKGACATSGCCICIGYYVFAYIYNCCHEPKLTRQFYMDNFAEIVSYSNYILMNGVVHIVLPVSIYYCWHEHVSVGGSVAAFIFHRCWSAVNSNFTTIYLDGSPIYKVHSLPSWGWTIVYIGEFTVLVLSTVLAMTMV